MQQDLYKAMLAVLPQQHPDKELETFYRLIRDYPRRGGKLLRGQFVLLSALAHGGSVEAAMPVAVALELFQNWVLIHDDIEDGSEERRGEKALHRQVGMPIALNVGDALHIYMWQVLLGLKLEYKDAIAQEFLTMIHRTSEGQHLDLSWVEARRFDISEAEYLQMVSLKTAYYTVISPLRLGAWCAGKEPHQDFEPLGKALGIGFQIRDDVLNLLPSKTYGKEFAGDLYEGKRTLILAYLFSQLNSAEKRQLETYLAKEREQKNSEETTEILGLINKYKALDYAQKVADDHAQTGLELLINALAPLPEQGRVNELTGLLESLAKRNT
ncbi:MAG: polyprenyl synthetase family protein [Trueperaceae bacterium]|nr:polyprenyl synthetase family protein [Trueperaceae bacterium]